jgi:polyhydroxyalkanoate synthesis repressor PhaR
VRYVRIVKAKHSQGGEPLRFIKRYENRKLYDPAARRYVTLQDLAAMIGAGEELHVADQKSGEDLTTLVLAQVILEGIKERTASIPRQVLSRLIRLGHAPAKAWTEWAAPQQVAARAKAEAERIASDLSARGRLTLEEALALRQEIARTVGGIASEAQRGLEARLHGLLQRSDKEGGVAPSLNGLRERLMAFETYLAAPGKTPAKGRAARPRKRQRAQE